MIGTVLASYVCHQVLRWRALSRHCTARTHEAWIPPHLPSTQQKHHCRYWGFIKEKPAVATTQNVQKIVCQSFFRAPKAVQSTTILNSAMTIVPTNMMDHQPSRANNAIALTMDLENILAKLEQRPKTPMTCFWAKPWQAFGWARRTDLIMLMPKWWPWRKQSNL